MKKDGSPGSNWSVAPTWKKSANGPQTEGRPSPIQPDKAATDRDFDAAIDLALDHLDHLHIVCGTHNEASTARLAEGMLAAGLSPDDERVAFAQLLGMSDNLSFNLAHRGFTPRPNTCRTVPCAKPSLI